MWYKDCPQLSSIVAIYQRVSGGERVLAANAAPDEDYLDLEDTLSRSLQTITQRCNGLLFILSLYHATKPHGQPFLRFELIPHIGVTSIRIQCHPVSLINIAGSVRIRPFFATTVTVLRMLGSHYSTMPYEYEHH